MNSDSRMLVLDSSFCGDDLVPFVSPSPFVFHCAFMVTISCSFTLSADFLHRLSVLKFLYSCSSKQNKRRNLGSSQSSFIISSPPFIFPLSPVTFGSLFRISIKKFIQLNFSFWLSHILACLCECLVYSGFNIGLSAVLLLNLNLWIKPS